MATISEIYNDIISDIESEMGVKVPAYGKTFIRAIAAVQAAKLYIINLSIDFLKRNTLPDTADSQDKGGTLLRWGRIVLGRYPFSATQAQYDVTVTGQIGATIEASTTFQSRANSQSPNQLYVLDNQFTFSSTTETITLRALDAGLASSLEVGDELIATVPIDNVNKTAVVDSEIVTPEDGETNETYRQRILEAFRTEPQGGAAVDYRGWANEITGVAQSYPYAAVGINQAGNIDVYVEATQAASTDGKGTPSTQLIQDVQSAIEINPDTTLPIGERGRKPLGVIVDAQSITPLDVTVTVDDFQDLTAVKESAIKDEIITTVNAIRPFVDSIDSQSSRNDVLTSNAVISAITLAVPGSVFGNVTVTVDGNSISSYQFIRFNIPYIDSSMITINSI